MPFITLPPPALLTTCSTLRYPYWSTFMLTGVVPAACWPRHWIDWRPSFQERRIVKVNIDQNPQLASEFNVQSIPTLAFIVQGKVVGQSAGAPPEATLRRVLNQLTSAA